MSKERIICRDVSLGYEGKTIISDLNFTVDSGDYLCIVGENGSGKSTLVKGLLGLKQPQKGALTLGFKPGEIGYLPQQTPAQKDFPASVYEVVLSGCISRRGFRPFYGKNDKTAALMNLERLGIADLRHACYRELSGGQQQRVLLARALCAACGCHRPLCHAHQKCADSILLLDEPVAGLDPVATADLYQSIAEVNAAGLTIVMVSHDMHSAVHYASHILHLAKNKPLFFGKTAGYVLSDEGKEFLGCFQHERCHGG